MAHRQGKTKRDRESGAPARRAANREAREAWMKDSRKSEKNFPKQACNGKRNRSVYTGKENVQVVKY